MWTLLATLALAQEEPAAPRLCADAAAGEEIDVCVALAAEHPGQVDGIAAALRAHVDRAEAADRELLAAVLALLSDGEAALDGAARLGASDDPRAIGPLLQAARTREPAVALAAVAALAEQPRAVEPLSRFLLDRALPLDVRVAAADALAHLGDEAGADALLAALRRSDLPGPLRDAVDAALRDGFPARIPELEDAVRRDGSLWLAGGAGIGLGQALGAAGHFGRRDLSAVGAATGVVTGATAGWVLGRAWPMEAADASLIATAGAMGVVSGSLVGHASTPFTARTDGQWLGGVVGGAAGYGLGLGLRRAHRGDVGDVLVGNLFGVATGVVAGTATEFAWKSGAGGWSWGPNPPLRRGQLATGLGLAAGTVVGHLAAPHLRLSSRDALFIGLTSTYGLMAGIVAPVPDERYGLPALGLASGALAGAALSAVVEPGPDSVVGGATGMMYGGALGAGLGLLADADGLTDGAVPRGFALAGATVGLGAGAFVAYRNPEFLDPADLVFVSLVTGWAGWQSLGWYTANEAPPRLAGWFVAAPALVGATAAATTPLVDVPIEYSFSGLSLGLWGTYAGSAAGRLAGRDSGQRLAWSLVGSDIGLGLGLLAAAPPLSAPPLVIGLADAGGVLGASLFALTASFVTPDPDQVLVSSLIGAGVGFAGGALLGAGLHRSGRARDVALVLPAPPDLPGAWTLAPAALPGDEGLAWGVVVRGSGW